MAAPEPTSAMPLIPDEPRPLPAWAEANRRLAEAGLFWLATVRPDGRPHVVPLLAVWRDGVLFFAAGAATRKARNLADDPRCVVATERPDLHLIVEGTAARVTETADLRRLAGAYAAKYGWEVEVRAGAFHADGAPTAGPPPYDLYAVAPTAVFAFGADETIGAVRWTFA